MRFERDRTGAVGEHRNGAVEPALVGSTRLNRTSSEPAQLGKIEPLQLRPRRLAATAAAADPDATAAAAAAVTSAETGADTSGSGRRCGGCSERDTCGG